MPTAFKILHDCANTLTSLLWNLETVKDQEDQGIIKAKADAQKLKLRMYELSRHFEVSGHIE